MNATISGQLVEPAASTNIPYSSYATTGTSSETILLILGVLFCMLGFALALRTKLTEDRK